jgi:hypothetical protein
MASVTSMEGRHRVEQVGEAAHAGIQATPCLVVAGGGVAGADPHASAVERPDEVRIHDFRRQGHDHLAEPSGGEKLQGPRIHGPDQRFVMNTLARGIEVGAFEVDTPKPGQTVFQGRLDGTGAAFHDRPVVADQGRPSAGGAVAPVGLADGADEGSGRPGVHQLAEQV